MGKAITDLRNRKFGKLLVCDDAPFYQQGKSQRVIYWNCVCDCGKKVALMPGQLTAGRRVSCGCLTGGAGQRRPPRNREGYDYGNPALACFYAAYKAKARIRGIEFGISPADFVGLVNQSCYYCGEKYHYSFQYASRTRKENNGYSFIGCGLDRIDPNKGYVPGNIVPACKNCNFAKLEQSQEDFLLMIEKIYKKHFCATTED